MRYTTEDKARALVEIKNEDGEVFSRSKNLRGIFTHARRFKWNATALAQNGKTLQVVFPDRSTCRVEFADANVLRDWINNRVKYGRGRFMKGT